jgi:hypothetical protein
MMRIIVLQKPGKMSKSLLMKWGAGCGIKRRQKVISCQFAGTARGRSLPAILHRSPRSLLPAQPSQLQRSAHLALHLNRIRKLSI